MAPPDGELTLSGSRDRTQLDLLSRWPRFTLPRGYTPGWRDFRTCTSAGCLVDCGRYGLIDPRPSPNWRQYPPAPTFQSGGVELGTYLAHMLQKSPGYGREASGSSNHWSTTISELLSVTGSLVFAHAAGFHGKRPRKNVQVAFTTPLCFDSKRFLPDRQVPTGGKSDNRDDDEDDGQGISLIYVAIERDG